MFTCRSFKRSLLVSAKNVPACGWCQYGGCGGRCVTRRLPFCKFVEKHYICITMEKKEMQHKDIVAELARRLERGEADVEALADGFVSLLKEHCGALETVAVPGFGKFEGEKLMERVEVDSASGRRMLYPPEIRMTFVPGTRLKTRIAEKGEAGDE